MGNIKRRGRRGGGKERKVNNVMAMLICKHDVEIF
jgi:hypothetical protein